MKDLKEQIEGFIEEQRGKLVDKPDFYVAGVSNTLKELDCLIHPEPEFKVGDKFRSKYDSCIYVISEMDAFCIVFFAVDTGLKHSCTQSHFETQYTKLPAGKFVWKEGR